MADLSCIYISASEHGIELRCREHEDWWTALRAKNLPTVIGYATAHFADAHRIHVDGCMCAGRVIDGRCLQPIAYFGGSGS